MVATPPGVFSDHRPPGPDCENSCQNWFGPDGAPIGIVAHAVPAEASDVARESGAGLGGGVAAGRSALLPQPAVSTTNASPAAALVMPTAGSGWPRRPAERQRTTS
jgi:hypothetical protein